MSGLRVAHDADDLVASELQNLRIRVDELRARIADLESRRESATADDLVYQPVFSGWSGLTPPFPKGRRKRSVRPPPPTLADFAYTAEMRERARKRIEARLSAENPELVFQEYVETCFKSFLRRMTARRAEQQGKRAPEHRDALLG
jgi:hypothetical protein